MSPVYIAQIECIKCGKVVQPVFNHPGLLPTAAAAVLVGEIEPPHCNQSWRLHAIRKVTEDCPEMRVVNPDHRRVVESASGGITQLVRKTIRALLGPCRRPP